MRKSLHWLLLLALIFVLAACNKEGAKPADTDPKPPEEQEQPEEEEVVVDELPENDFGGMTLTWAAPWQIVIDPDSNEFNEKWHARITELEEKWNFKLDLKEVGWDDYIGNYVRTTLAGEPVADIVYMLTNQFYPNLVSNGILYPVSDLGILDYNDPKWNKAGHEASEYKGSKYSLLINVEGSTRDAIWWNKTLFDELGLPDLYELYENGEWTWDKMVEIAEMATKDTNNDGETDIYGVAIENFPWKLIYANGYESIIKTDSGIDIDMSDPKVTEALEFYQKFAQNHGHTNMGWFDGASWDYRITNFRDGNIAMLSGEWWNANNYFRDGMMQDEYGMVPFPTGPSHDQPVSYGYEARVDPMLATVKNPEDKVTIWNEITNFGDAEDWNNWTREIFEGAANDAETVEYAMMLNSNTKTNLIRGFDTLNGIFNDFFGQLASGSTTVQTGLEAINPQIQAALVDFKEHGVVLGYDEEPEEEEEE